MAYMSQQKKAELSPGIKAVLKNFHAKATIAVSRGHSTLVVNIVSSPLDLIDNYVSKVNQLKRERGGDLIDRPSYISVNEYSIDECFSGECARFLNQLKAAMMTGNHDNSDIMTDYFDVGWYIDINIGKWDKAYVLSA